MTTKNEVVCITGGSGFIGPWLVQLLLRFGCTVHAIVKDIGTVGVFHLSSPNIIDQVHDPEELIEPAITGTKYVLRAAKEMGIKCVVVNILHYTESKLAS